MYSISNIHIFPIELAIIKECTVEAEDDNEDSQPLITILNSNFDSSSMRSLTDYGESSQDSLSSSDDEDSNDQSSSSSSGISTTESTPRILLKNTLGSN